MFSRLVVSPGLKLRSPWRSRGEHGGRSEGL